jgi:hypothetical protein
MSVRSDIIKVVRDIIAQAKKIVDLPSAPSVAGTDLIEVSIGGVSYKATASQIGAGGSGVVKTIVAGTGISVDSTDPANPIVSATGGGGSGTVTSVSFTGGLISVATATTTPALTVAGTSGGIPYFSSSSTWASSGALAANAIVIGGGAGNAPSTTTTGTGVLTALGINVGSAGAFVTFNGAGGTPSSLTLTNATGLPISTGVSGLGTGVATFLVTPSWTNFSSMITGTAPYWATTGTSTLTGTTTIANGGNNLTFSGAGTHSFTSTSATVAGNFTVGGSYTVPAGAAINAYLATFGGTLTSKGTANDTIAGVRINSVLTNSTGGPVAHVGLRIDATATGSTTPANAISLQVLGMTASATNNEIIRGISNAGINRWQLRNDGSQLWTTTVTGTDLGGTMSTNASNNTGHIIHSFQLSGSTTTAHTHWGIKYTGGMNTNATNAVYYSQWDARSIVVGHTGLTVYGWYYDPQFSGAQAGTQTNYAIIAASGLSGFQAASNAPTAVVHIGAVTTSRASLRIDPGSTTTAPSSPNSGDIWHEGTGNRLMFRQGSASNEIICASAVTTESVVSDTTVTIKLNNVTYKLLARA